MKTRHVLTAALALGVSLTNLGARADTLYVSAYDDNAIVKITQSGSSSVFASGVSSPQGLAFDSAGNLFVAGVTPADLSFIMKFTPEGSGSVFASTGLNGPKGLAFDPFGNLFVANENDNTIHKFTPGGVDSIFADASDGLNLPTGLAFDSAGNLFVGNAANNSPLLKFTPDGVGSVFAPLQATYGLAFDSAGNLYATGVASIYKFTSGGVRSFFADGLSLGGGPAFDSAGNLYVPDRDDSDIKKFAPDGTGTIFSTVGASEPHFVTFGPDVVPEPGAFGLVAVGALVIARRRRQT